MFVRMDIDYSRATTKEELDRMYERDVKRFRLLFEGASRNGVTPNGMTVGELMDIFNSFTADAEREYQRTLQRLRPAHTV